MMTKLEEKRVEWMYSHFQGITEVSDRYLILYGLLCVTSLAVWTSAESTLEFPFLKVAVAREGLLGCTLLAATCVFIAFCGNFDQGEFTVANLAKALDCDYSDLWFIDNHPSFLEFWTYRRPTSAAKRRLPARVTAHLLYPIVLVGPLAFLTAVWAWEAFMRSMSLVSAAPFVVMPFALFVAWNRACEYTSRRWDTLAASERQRRAK